MTKRQVIAGLALAAVAATGLVAAPAAAQRKAESTAKQRSNVSITVYNQNFGLVREVRELDSGTGKVELSFQDVAQTIQPETVSIRALGGAKLNVLEQNYRYDLLTPQKLLEKHVGKKVKLYRFNEKTGKDEVFEAKVLSYANGQPVLEIGGEVTYGFPGRFAFKGVPDNLMPKPTLVWLVDSGAAKPKVEVTYLARNMGWKADYVFVINEDDTRGNLTGWVTLNNNTGATYDNATLKLVAGDVQRVSGRDNSRYAQQERKYKADKESGFSEESFFEYHLYSLQRPTSVKQNEQKQVTLLEAENAKVEKQLLFYGQQYWYRGRYGQVQSNQKVGVYLDLPNTKANNMGMALPKGVVRVYKKDKSGAQQFIGEDSIDHTPRDEKVRIKMGEAFDIVGDRKQMSWRAMGSCVHESSWEIELRNHKDEAERVQIFEPIGGDWNILKSSHPAKKLDSATFKFDVRVPARGKTKVTYSVRVRWC